MPFDVDAMRAYTVPVSLEIGKQTLKCDVSPEIFASESFRTEMNRISAEIAQKEKDSSEENESGEEKKIKPVMKIDYSDFNYALASVITDWDMVDKDKNKVPVSEESVASLWWQARVALWNLIIETLSPKALTRPMPRTSSGPRAR